MNNGVELEKLLQYHMQIYKIFEIQDVYKLLYQGLFGAEHLLSDFDRAQKRLIQEWEQQQSDASEPMIVPVSLDGAIVRINMRSCKAAGVTVEEVWAAFSHSAPHPSASKQQFAALWQRFSDLCTLGRFQFDAEHVERFGRTAQAAGFPAQHHSNAYRTANAPAYRVASLSELKKRNIY